MKKYFTAMAALASLGLTVPTSAIAQGPWHWDGGRDSSEDYDDGYRHGSRDASHRFHDGYDEGFGDGYDEGRSREPARPARQACSSGTGGTIIGGVAGALLGNQLVRKSKNRTVGTILGGGVGALAGRALDRRC